MTLADYQKPDGGYRFGGGHYDTATDLIQTGMLKFCACGAPEQNLLYVLGGLELIDEDRPDGTLAEFHKWCKKWEKRRQVHFGSEAAADFFFYWADSQELTEHGSSVPGWLTNKGKELMTLLREWKEMPDEA